MLESKNLSIIPLSNQEIIIKNKNIVNNQLLISKNQIEELILLLEETKDERLK